MILTHPSGETIDTAMIERMITEAGNTDAVDYRTSIRRDSIRRELQRLGVKVRAIKVDLQGPDGNSGKLGAGDAYLANNPDEKREAIWMEWLTNYETCCDLQDRIADVVLSGEGA